MSEKLEFPTELLKAIDVLCCALDPRGPHGRTAQQAADLIRSQHKMLEGLNDMVEAVTLLAEKAAGGTLPSYTRAINALKEVANTTIGPKDTCEEALDNVISIAKFALNRIPMTAAELEASREKLIGVGAIDAKLLEDLREIGPLTSYNPIELARAIADHVDAKLLAFGEKIMRELGGV